MSIFYPFSVSERIIFAEIYFPKRAAYYGAIFKALREGYREEKVKKYLDDYADALRGELQSYPGLLDPHQYETAVRKQKQLTVEQAKARIAMYVSPFKG